MTDENRSDDVVEDLEAPAAAQGDVAGGVDCNPSTYQRCTATAQMTTITCDKKSVVTTSENAPG